MSERYLCLIWQLLLKSCQSSYAFQFLSRRLFIKRIRHDRLITTIIRAPCIDSRPSLTLSCKEVTSGPFMWQQGVPLCHPSFCTRLTGPSYVFQICPLADHDGALLIISSKYAFSKLFLLSSGQSEQSLIQCLLFFIPGPSRHNGACFQPENEFVFLTFTFFSTGDDLNWLFYWTSSIILMH